MILVSPSNWVCNFSPQDISSILIHNDKWVSNNRKIALEKTQRSVFSLLISNTCLALSLFCLVCCSQEWVLNSNFPYANAIKGKGGPRRCEIVVCFGLCRETCDLICSVSTCVQSQRVFLKSFWSNKFPQLMKRERCTNARNRGGGYSSLARHLAQSVWHHQSKLPFGQPISFDHNHVSGITRLN